MPDIGAMLRETRMRQRIDIAEVETATKIRAKYLRALENEEWDLLPGPTYVKTFLRTYGDYLGLDSKLLVEEYKQRYERPSASELMPFGPGLGGRRQRRPPVVPPFAIVGACVVALLVVLFLLGSLGDEEPERAATPPTITSPQAEAPRERERSRERRRRQRPAPTAVRLRIIPTGTVNVCLVDARGRELIRSQNLEAGQTTQTFRSRRFRVTFGNGQAQMRIGSRTVDVPDREDPVGYEITPRRRRELPAGQRPTCA
jgi:cytoskeleton protein RodZ